MFAEMTPDSKRSQEISRTGIERNQCLIWKQQKLRSERTCHFSEPRSKGQSRTKSSSLRNCLTFCFKNQVKMEQKEPSFADVTEGRLRELTSKWFIDTQVPLIVHNGLFPTWFLGFTSRKGAEEILRQKQLGCFLIRLSDKAIGYILSYKGSDRCRHFVINQSDSGHFVICGDTEEHGTVYDLIEYYKSSPMQPFGEFLTSSCFEVLNEELYDTIQVSLKESPADTAAAFNSMHTQSNRSQQPPMRPPKNSRAPNEAPPLPRRSRHLDIIPQNDKDRVLYAQLRKHSPRDIPSFHHYCQDGATGEYPGRAERSPTWNIRRYSPTSGPESFIPELSLMDTKNLSVPFLDDSSEAERPYLLRASPHTSPRLSPKAIRQTTYYGLEMSISGNRETSSHSLEYVSDNVVYHLAGRPGNPLSTLSENNSEQNKDSVYAEVPSESLAGHSPHANTYELIPRDEDAVDPKTNMYEPLEDIRPKQNHSTWGFKNDKWRWLFPDAKRK